MIRKNAINGISFGFLFKITTLVFPFIIQTVVIHTLGAEFTGIKGLFTSILTVINVAELGVGNAIAYSMYKPVAEDDIATICALLKVYKKVYRIIGVVITCLGLAVTPFLKLLISGEYPKNLNIYVVFCFTFYQMLFHISLFSTGFHF